jgi:hypothetical protein
MIPKINKDFTADFKTVEQPSKTYRLDMERKVVVGYTNGLEAVKQAVYKILNTERYEFIIYSSKYGSELKDLFGEQMTFVTSEIKRRIREALMQDDRITDVDGFKLERSREELHVYFNVISTEGEFESEVTISV